MSAPKVGDRVRVIAGQWTGWEGVVAGTSLLPYVWVDLEFGAIERGGTIHPCTLYAHEVEVIEP